MEDRKGYSILMYNFGNYETPREPAYVDPEADYIYVTDNEDFKSEHWNVVVDHDLDGLDPFGKCYNVRYNLFKYCSTDTCIYLDGSIQLNKPLDKLYSDFVASKCDLGLIVHPERYMLIHEYETWILTRGYSEEQARRILHTMELMGYDFDYKGLFQLNARIERNTRRNKELDRTVLSLLSILGERPGLYERLDQTVYTFVLNKFFTDLTVFPMSQQVVQSDCMTWCLHGSPVAIPYNPFNDHDGYVRDELRKLYRLE